MADTLPINFPLPAETANATYNYIDIINGLGMVEFYAGSSQEGGTEDYHLSPNVFYSNTIELRTPDTFNFDTASFNTPRRVKGTAYVNFGHWETSSGGTSAAVIRFYKVSGGTPTAISSEITADKPVGNGAGKMCFVAIALTETNFAIGDYLRMAFTTAVSSGDLYIGIDPAGREGIFLKSSTTPPTTTTMKVWVPFKIDI